MDAITYSTAREKLAETMDKVCDRHEPVIITRRKAGAVVMLSLDDWNAIEETAYLLRSPANAARLRASMAHEADGDYSVRELIEE